MEPNKNYLTVGIFVLAGIAGIALFFIWLTGMGSDQDYRPYRIRFGESVNGLGLGSPVKFHGVDVGRVEAIAIDLENTQLITVDVRILKGTPVKTDTYATLRLQGITGTAYIELERGSVDLPDLETKHGKPAEIPSRPSDLASLINQAPALMNKASKLADQASAIISDKNAEALAAILEHMNRLSYRLDAESENMQNIIKVTSHMVSSLDRIATRVENGKLDESLNNIRAASEDFKSFSHRTDAAAKSYYTQFYQLLGDVRKTSRDLRDLTHSLKEDPSQLLYAPRDNSVSIP